MEISVQGSSAVSSHQSLLNELRSFGGVLTTCMGIKVNASLPPALCNALLHQMVNDGPLAKSRRAVERWWDRKMGMRDKLTWPFKEKKAAAIVDKLKPQTF
jgi:hypothetical protein